MLINDCRHLLATILMNSHAKYIRKQANEIGHNLAMVTPSLTSFDIIIIIIIIISPTCIQSIIINEMI
jgi:hypothetical protein